MRLLRSLFSLLRNWWTLELAEVILERQLQQNQCFPFQEHFAKDGRMFYVYSRRVPYLYFGLVGVLFSIFSFLMYILTGGDQEYYVYVTIILFASIYCIIRYWERQSVVLEPNAFKYHMYLQHKLVHVGSYKNIYIRMIKKQSGLGQFQFYLVIDGCSLVAPIAISRLTRNTKRLRHLAVRLAQVIGLNYFDVEDFSNKHLVRSGRPVNYQQHGKDEWEEEGVWHHKKISQDTILSSIASMLRENRSQSDVSIYEATRHKTRSNISS